MNIKNNVKDILRKQITIDVLFIFILVYTHITLNNAF